MSMRQIPFVVLVLVLAACDRSQAPSPAPTESKAATAPSALAFEEGSSPSRPTRSQAPDPALLPTNTSEMLSRLAPRDRELVEGFYRNYGDSVMAFSNKEELLWMIRHDYPMPEDVLEAATQTDQELQARYEAGDVKAGFFLLDRKAAALHDGKSDLDTYRLADELLVSGSPFSGYAFYRYNSQLTDSQGMALAGLLWADWQGDYRAIEQLMRLTEDGARFDGTQLSTPAEVAISYQALLSTVSASNRGVLMRKPDLLLQKRNM